MPIRIEPEDHSTTQGSSTNREDYLSPPRPEVRERRNGRPRNLIIDPSSESQIRIRQIQQRGSLSPNFDKPSGAVESPPGEGDRISFEIPSGTRGRLRVSLAWFRDVRSTRKWKSKHKSPDWISHLPSHPRIIDIRLLELGMMKRIKD